MNRKRVENVWNQFKGKVGKLTGTMGKIWQAPIKEACAMREEILSRRGVLRGALVVGCGLLAPALFSATASGDNSASLTATARKVSPASVKYQSHPKDGQKCVQCVNFIAASSTCKRVDGQINPGGWCILWAKKG